MWPFTRGAACSCLSGWHHHITPPGLRIHKDSPLVRALQSVRNVSSDVSKSVRGFASRIQGCFRNCFLSAKSQIPVPTEPMDKTWLEKYLKNRLISFIRDYPVGKAIDLQGAQHIFWYFDGESGQGHLSEKLPDDFSSVGRLNVKKPGSGEFYSAAQDIILIKSPEKVQADEWKDVEFLGKVLCRKALDENQKGNVYFKRDEQQVFCLENRAVNNENADFTKSIGLLQKVVGDLWTDEQKILYHEFRHIHSERQQSLSRIEAFRNTDWDVEKTFIDGEVQDKLHNIKNALRINKDFRDCCFSRAENWVQASLLTQQKLMLTEQQIKDVKLVIDNPDYPS